MEETAERELGCVGLLCDDLEAKIEGGELFVRGACVLDRYADGTSVVDEDGWFSTGDLVELKEGTVLLKGRKMRC